LRGVRPGNVHNPGLGGSAGLIRGFGRCAHALLGEVCAALNSAMLMTAGHVMAKRKHRSALHMILYAAIIPSRFMQCWIWTSRDRG
jgi:hypothetical protein